MTTKVILALVYMAVFGFVLYFHPEPALGGLGPSFYSTVQLLGKACFLLPGLYRQETEFSQNDGICKGNIAGLRILYMKNDFRVGSHKPDWTDRKSVV